MIFPASRACFLASMLFPAVFSGGCAWFSSIPALAAAPSEEDYRAAFLGAEIARSSGDFEGAIKALERFKNNEDCPPEVLTGLAESYLGAGQAEKGLSLINEVIGRFPDFVPALELRASLYRRTNETDKAIADLEAVLVRSPRNPGVLEELGMLRLRAMRDWSYKEGEPSDAARLIEVYQKLAEVQNGSQKVLPLVILASIYSQVGEKEKAISTASAAVKIRSHDVRAQLALGEAYENGGKLKEALEAYRQALLIEPRTAQIRKKVAEMIKRTGAEGGTLKFYGELATAFPGIKEIQESYGEELIAAKEWKKAAEQYQKILGLWPENHEARVALVKALLADGQTDAASTIVEGLLKEEATSPREMLELAQALRSTGKLNLVIDLLKRVAAAQKNDTRIMVALAMVEVEAGQKDEAAKTLEEVMAAGGTLPEVALRLLVDIYAGKNDFESAQRAVDKYIGDGKKPESKSGRNIKAWVYWRAKDYGNAAEILQALHTEEPGNVEIVEFLAENLGEMGAYSKAQELVETSRKAIGGDADERLLLLEARLYRKQENHEGAIRTMEKLIALKQDNDQYLMITGEYYYLAGRIDDAEKVLRKAIELNPENAEAYNSLGYFFAEAGVKLDEAEKLIRKALDLRPGAAHIMDSLGWVYYQQGDYPKAIDSLQKALKLMGEEPDPVALEHLGDAQAKNGELKKARENWQRALKLDPKSKTLPGKLAKE